jgi:hypothetical protein
MGSRDDAAEMVCAWPVWVRSRPAEAPLTRRGAGDQHATILSPKTRLAKRLNQRSRKSAQNQHILWANGDSIGVEALQRRIESVKCRPAGPF